MVIRSRFCILLCIASSAIVLVVLNCVTEHQDVNQIQDTDDELMSLLENMDSENYRVRFYASGRLHMLSQSRVTAERMLPFEDRIESIAARSKDHTDPLIMKSLSKALDEIRKYKK